MKEEYKKLLGDAEVILLNKSSLQYMGILSYGLKKEILNPEEYHQRTSMPSLAFTDGKTITFLARENVPREEIICLNIHEILHIISDHIGRAGSRDNTIWALACDQVVNRVLIKLSQAYNYIKIPEGMFYLKDLDEKYPEASVEEIYDILYQQMPQFKIGMKKIGKFSVVEVSNEKVKFTVGIDTDKTAIVTEEQEKNIKDLQHQARTLWQADFIQKGSMSGNLISYLNKVFEVVIPWHTILESAIMYFSQSDTEASWAKRNYYIRHIPLPSYINGSDVKVLIACVDSSGSISEKNLKQFFGVLLGSVKHFKSIIVIVHDVKIHHEIYLENNPNEVDIIKSFYEVKGRGGTSHKDAFDYIENAVEENEVSTVVFLTDFESDIQHIYKKYEWIKSLTSIWVLNKEKPINVELDGCKTKTIHLDNTK